MSVAQSPFPVEEQPLPTPEESPAEVPAETPSDPEHVGPAIDWDRNGHDPKKISE